MVFILKTEYHRMHGAGSKGFRAHSWYLVDTKEHELMDHIEMKNKNGNTMSRAEIKEFLDRADECKMERRTVISPEQYNNVEDMNTFAKNYMKDYEKMRDQKLDYVYVTHTEMDKNFDIRNKTHVLEIGSKEDIADYAKKMERREDLGERREIALEDYHHLDLEKEYKEDMMMEKELELDKELGLEKEVEKNIEKTFEEELLEKEIEKTMEKDIILELGI